jgi:hypothetical protein
MPLFPWLPLRVLVAVFAKNDDERREADEAATEGVTGSRLPRDVVMNLAACWGGFAAMLLVVAGAAGIVAGIATGNGLRAFAVGLVPTAICSGCALVLWAKALRKGPRMVAVRWTDAVLSVVAGLAFWAFVIGVGTQG